MRFMILSTIHIVAAPATTLFQKCAAPLVVLLLHSGNLNKKKKKLKLSRMMGYVTVDPMSSMMLN